MKTGQDIIDLAMTKVGQTYVLGAEVDFQQAGWSGPWDCAEFATWAVFQVIGKFYGARPSPRRPGGQEAWTAHWDADRKAGLFREIDVADALATAGAILLRPPNAFNIKTGHIAFSRGDSTTIEAHSRAVGVASRSAQRRYWSSGLLLNEVTYERRSGDVFYLQPRQFWRLTNPETFGPGVRRIKRRMIAKDLLPQSALSDVFDEEMANAVVTFQIDAGLVADGIVGPNTLKALGFIFYPTAQA